MKPVKRAAVLHDICGVGKAALTNIIPVLSIKGIEACPIPTYVLSTHTGGFGKPAMQRLSAFPAECADHYEREGITFDTILVGYLGNREAVESALYFIQKNRGARVVLDPVFGDHGKHYLNFTKEYEEALKMLMPFADIITPNYTEACLLAGEEYRETSSQKELRRISEKLKDMGSFDVVITSAPVQKQDKVGIYMSAKASDILFEWKKAGGAYPGTGDIFAAALTAFIIEGEGLEQAVQMAHQFVSKCIEVSSSYSYPAREGVLLERCLKYL